MSTLLSMSLPASLRAGVDRRSSLRLTLLALAASGGAAALTGCGSDDDIVDPAPPPPDGGIALVASDVERAAGDPSLVPEVVAGLRGLTGGLYDGLRAEDGNVVLSPYSVLVALGMTLNGAAGATEQEMRDVLGVGGLGDRWHKGVNALTAHLTGLAGEQQRGDGSTAEVVLATANQLFGQRDVGWEADFLDLLAKEYAAGVRTVDFAAAPEDARLLINAWVEEQTADRITDLIPAGVIDSLTRLVLVNAVHLKAPWEKPFEEELTATGPFALLDGSSVDADLMRQPALAGTLVAGEKWRAATVPYAGRGLAMTLVLPDVGAFAQVEQEFATNGFTVPGGRSTVLDLTLPKWQYRTNAPLSDLLKSLGMPTAFVDGKADFTPMTDEDLPLHIGAVLHQGFIAVDEEGTEAAAATAVVMGTTSAPVVQEFVVDRPFLYVIHDLDHGTPLFVGRVVDPTA